MRNARSCRMLAIGLALLALTVAAPAGAQMTFDGNIVWNNFPNGDVHNDTCAANYIGKGSATNCAQMGYHQLARLMCTVDYTHNYCEDPLLAGAVYQANTIPNWKPGVGSPAWREPVVIIDDDFFKTVRYHGAISPNDGENWVKVSTWGNGLNLGVPNTGWVIYDSTGANRQDLHLAGMPDPRPLAVYPNINLYNSQVWSADSNYLIRGQLRVKSLANLTIPAGTVIFGERATLGTIVIERGGHISAIGTEDNPIIMTCDDPPGYMQSGAWGGLVVNGYGRTNIVNSCAGDSVASEGGAIGYWGGDDNTWDGCQLKYVRIEYSGKEITPNNELNSFTLNGMGSNSHMDYCEAFYGQDDAFEWFGGKMDCSHLLGYQGKDDGIDTQLGTQLRVQFAIIENSPYYTIAGTQNGDKGTEQDNNEYDFEAQTCHMSPCGSGNVVPEGNYYYNRTRLANCTFIGDHRMGAAFPGPTFGVNWRRGASGQFFNSIVAYEKSGALHVDDNATWAHHCACMPGQTSIVDVPPIASGKVFVAAGAPNPFRNRLNVAFTLPQSGPVKVQIFSMDGRLVETLADGEMGAGPHSIEWNVNHRVAAGMYFYRVTAGESTASGRITRVR